MTSRNCTVEIEGEKILSAEDFHSYFATTFEFPAYYGRNWDAWIECMSESAERIVKLRQCAILTLNVRNQPAFQGNCPDVWGDFIDCTAFINSEFLDAGNEPILAVSYTGSKAG